MKAELCANCIQHGNECNKAVAEKLLAEARLQDAAAEVRRLREQTEVMLREIVSLQADNVALRQRHAADKSCRTCRWLVVAESDGRPLCEIGVRGCVDRETGLCAAWLASEAKARLT